MQEDADLCNTRNKKSEQTNSVLRRKVIYVKNRDTYQIPQDNKRLLESSLPEDLAGLKIPGCYFSRYDAELCIHKCVPPCCVST